MQEIQNGIKTDDIKRLKDQAKDFLDTHFFYAAVDMYERVLSLDPSDTDSHLGILMGKAMVTSQDELISFYLKHYSIQKTEILYATKKDEETIRRLCDLYWVNGYLSKEDISRSCLYDLSYESNLNACISQKEEFLHSADNDEHLACLKANKSVLIEKILAFLDKMIIEARKQDELNTSLIKEDYEKFLKDVEQKIRVLHFEAKEKRDYELSVLADRYENSQDVGELNELIKEFESFKDCKEADQFLELCRNKIKVLTDKKNNKPSVSQMTELLSYARKALSEKRFSDAYEAFSEVFLAYPQNESSHLGLLEARYKAKDEAELFECFKNLYNEDKEEIIEAVKEDTEHIDEMIYKYTLPGYLEKEEIQEIYYFDRNCKSSYKNRLEEQKRFSNEIASDLSFRWLESKGSERIKSEISSVLGAYQDRADEAKAEERKNVEEVRSAYHRFLFSAYSLLRTKYEEALRRKDQDYKKLICEADQLYDAGKLNDLIIELQDFGDYKEINKYITLCRRRIDVIKEKEENERIRKELEIRLNEGKNALRSGNYSLAWRLFSNILSEYRNVPYAHLGLVMAQNGLKDEERFLDYYKYLFSEIKTEMLEACEEDKGHIEEVCDRYEVPGYLDKDKIRAYYQVDRRFASETSNRIQQKKQIEEEFDMNPYLSKARENADEHIRRLFDDILLAYDERIREAQKTDELKRSSVCDIYRYYLKESDRTISELYERKRKEKEENCERDYRGYLDRFNQDLTIEELRELIDCFDQNYKDGKFYIEECKKRISQLEKEKKQSDYSFNYENGIRCLKEKHFEAAKEHFSYCLKAQQNLEENHLNYLMADTGTCSIDELFDYYKVLYSEDIPIIKEAIQENNDHIENIFKKYYLIPDYIERDAIREIYRFDRSFASLSECRIRQKKQIEDLINNSPSLLWLMNNGSQSVKERFNELMLAYEERIVQAKERDNKSIHEVGKRYTEFLNKKDEELKAMYQGLLQKKTPEKKKNIVPEKTENHPKHGPETKEKKKEIINKGQIKKRENRSLIISSLAAIALFGLLFGVFYYWNNRNNDIVLYDKALNLFEKEEYDDAIKLFEQLGDYKESVYYLKQAKYQKAEQYYNERQYYEALLLFNNLRFNDSEERANTIQKELIANAKAGDYVFFGSYEQDGDISNGTEPIEWLVLGKENGKLLLLSRYGLDVKQFSDSPEKAGWENSDIRDWLNGTFINSTFNTENLNEILQTTLVNALSDNDIDDKNQKPEAIEDEKQDVSSSMQKSRDRVFLLSEQEIELYLAGNEKRQCDATKATSKKGIQDNNGKCSWWLRTASKDKNDCIYIVSSERGEIKNSPYNAENAVRPAIWVKTY